MIKEEYWTLTKFILPLVLTTIAQDVGEQALNRSLTASTTAVLEIASFGIAYQILGLFTGAIEDFKYISITLLRTNKDRMKVILVSSIFTIASLVLMLIVGFTGAGDVIINDFHGVSDNVGSRARKALYIFSLYPFIDGLAWIHAGILIKYKHSFLTGLGSIADVVTQVTVVAVLLKTSMAVNNVFYIPLIASYSGVVVRLLILICSYYKFCHHKILRESENSNLKLLSFCNIIKTWAPLMAVRLCQRVSRPLINLFVARDRLDGRTEADAIESLAVLSVVFPLCHIPYGWLNEIKALEATFTKKKENKRSEMKVKTVRIFGVAMFFVSTMLVIILAWIPGVAESILVNASNVTPSFALLCLVPIQIMGILPIPVINRALVTGWLIKVKTTSALYPTVVMRLGVIVVMVTTLPMMGIHGAVMGTTALVGGFIADALTALVGASVVKYKCNRRPTLNLLMQNTSDLEKHDESDNSKREHLSFESTL